MINLDTRHWAWCSLGPLAPEPSTIADTHVQGAGYVKVTGTVNLKGIYRPTPGSEVALAYSDGQRWIARLPRRLRVLASFADPLRGVTTVSVGCSLAYFEDRKPAVTNITNEEANPDLSDLERRTAAQSISASFVVGQILSTLGLTAAGSIPFTTTRVVDEWDLSAGYVEELGRIAQSEGYFARINEAGQVAFVSKDQEITAGPLVTQKEIIDLTPQTVGELPAESVYARFTRLRLVAPDPETIDNEKAVQLRNWEREQVNGGAIQSINTYTNAQGVSVKEMITYNDVQITQTTYDGLDRVIKRREYSNQLNGNRYTETVFSYASGVGTSPSGEDTSRVRREDYTEWTPIGDIAAACGKTGPAVDFRMGSGVSLTRATIYDKETSSGITQTKTYQQVLYINTPFGADAIAKLRDQGTETFQNIMVDARRLTSYGSSTRIRTEREFGLQKRPSQQARNRLADGKAPTVEQQAAITWAIGSPAAQTTLELSPPYVSDDRIITQNGTYVVVPSDAEQRSAAYARIENRLLLANRSGVGLQLLPIDAPPAPFDLLYVRMGGCTAACRMNGTTWTISPSGVVVTSDVLFWGAIDGTVDAAWFPLPPGATSLPATAAVTTNANPLPANAMAIPAGFNPQAPNLATLFAALPSGVPAVPRATINPSVVVRPFHETISLRGGVQVGARFTVQRWLPTTVVIGGGVRVGAGIQVAA